MKLSIIVPAYNEEKYIGKAILAIKKEIKRSGVEAEIIVVNNASTDNTGNILKTFSNVFVVNEPRKGLPQARQSGFEVSKGELIANIDADTQMPAGWISKVLKNFDSNSKLVALSGPYAFYDSFGSLSFWTRIYYLLVFITNFVNHRILHHGAVLQGGNFVLKREALEKINGFDTKIEFYGEDADVACRIQKFGLVKFSLDLVMLTSSRRYAREGVLHTVLKYFINYLKVNFFKKVSSLYKYTHVGD